MSDARWFDVEDDLASAIKHFGLSVRIFKEGVPPGDDLPAYKSRMALMQSMQSAYTSMERAYERILEILGEEKPTGSDYHAQLIKRVSRAFPESRPAIIEGALAEAVDETRRFRHVARKGYDGFRVENAGAAIAAADYVRAHIREAIEVFRSALEGADRERPEKDEGVAKS